MTHPAHTSATDDRKPRDDEIDVYGLTHPGLLRKENQDHFLICSLHKAIVIHGTSLPDLAAPTGADRVAFLAMVADGVGGGTRGEEASRLAVETVTRYVTDCMRCYYASDMADDSEFIAELQKAASSCHEDFLRRAETDPDSRGMATTLTLFLGAWPRAYLLQVGDSRYYIYRQGELSQLSRDQTMAQELIDIGVLNRADAARSRFATTLSSSIGGRQSAPVVSRLTNGWDYVHLLCSDGLTRHVPDERIRERVATMTSARQVCEDLLQDALDGGGSDNITIIAGRGVRSDRE